MNFKKPNFPKCPKCHANILMFDEMHECGETFIRLAIKRGDIKPSPPPPPPPRIAPDASNGGLAIAVCGILILIVVIIARFV